MKLYLFTCLIIPFVFFGQVPDSLINRLLQEKKAAFSFSGPIDQRIYFFGENHNYMDVDVLALKVFTALNSQRHVNTYCFEGGKSTEYLFNYYLSNGNYNTKSYLDGLKLFKKGFVKKFIKPLSEKFKSDTSLRFRCFDIETDLFNALSVSNHILMNSKNSELFSGITAKIQIPGIAAEKKYSQCRLLVHQFELDSTLFSNNMDPTEYQYLREIISGMTPGIVFDSLLKANKNEEALNYREMFISNNLKIILAHNNNTNCFVQIGINHLLGITVAKEIVHYKNIFSMNNGFAGLNPVKIGCTYAYIDTPGNYWLLNKQQIKALTRNTESYYILFDIKNIDGVPDKTFDYLIFCK